MKRLSVLLMATAMVASLNAHAGKVEDVQAAVKKSCGKDVNSSDALRLVKDLFLSCTPGAKVDVEGCQVGCLKENAGAVVGG